MGSCNPEENPNKVLRNIWNVCFIQSMSKRLQTGDQIKQKLELMSGGTCWMKMTLYGLIKPLDEHDEHLTKTLSMCHPSV